MSITDLAVAVAGVSQGAVRLPIPSPAQRAARGVHPPAAVQLRKRSLLRQLLIIWISLGRMRLAAVQMRLAAVKALTAASPSWALLEKSGQMTLTQLELSAP